MSKHRPSSLMLALFATSACDEQATPDYAGESLLALKGSVTLTEASSARPLVPALAFYNDNGRLDLVDVAVHGEFPSRFTLSVTAPPPASVMMAGPPGEPEFAIGNVTAVPADHPASLRRHRARHEPHPPRHAAPDLPLRPARPGPAGAHRAPGTRRCAGHPPRERALRHARTSRRARRRRGGGAGGERTGTPAQPAPGRAAPVIRGALWLGRQL